MVAALDLQAYHLLAAMNDLALNQPGALLQGLTAVIRREPNRMTLAADKDVLFDVKDQNTHWRLDQDFTIGVGHKSYVGDALEPLAHSLPPGGDFKVRRGKQVVRGDAEKRRLHGTGRYFEWLQKKSSDAHRHCQRDEQDFNILTPGGIRIGFEPFDCGRFQLLLFLFDSGLVGF